MFEKIYRRKQLNYLVMEFATGNDGSITGDVVWCTFVLKLLHSKSFRIVLLNIVSIIAIMEFYSV